MMSLARRVGIVDRGCHRSIHSGVVPLLGGLAIALPFLALVLLVSLSGMLPMDGAFNAEFLPVFLIGCAAVLALGIVDDFRPLTARTKLLFQVLIAIFVCLSGLSLDRIFVPFFGIVNLPPTLATALAVAWIVGIINSVNLIDGMDGLATGVCLIASLGIAVLAALSGNLGVACLCLALSAGLGGFLLFNFHPARIFLGDTGSMFLGFVIAVFAILAPTGSSQSAFCVSGVD